VTDDVDVAGGQREPTPSPRVLLTVGVFALLALVGLVASLEHWVAFDDAVWRRVLFLRSCSTDVVVERSIELATRALAVLLVVVVVLHVRTAGGRSVVPWLGTWALGLLVGKMLKHVLTRERPSALPDLAVGYSFPSAHVMNGLLAMLAVMVLVHRFPRRGRWRVLAALFTATLALGRLLLGRHWATDVLGGAASALALAGFVVPAMLRRPAATATVLSTLMVAALVADRRLGEGSIHLPTPLVSRRSALVEIDVGPEQRPNLHGGWVEAGRESVVGTYLWLLGDGTIPFDVGGDVLTSPMPLQVAFAGRPQRSARVCLTLDVELNGRQLGRFFPFVGWREYRLPIPANLLRPGGNTLKIAAAGRDGAARFGVDYVRIAAASGPE
jgi:membrane-associated phospholipid phosphatase